MRVNWLRSVAAHAIATTKTWVGVLFVVGALTSVAYGRVTETPEIDPGAATSALTLLIGGALVLTDRVRRKK